jgi:ribonuclease HI
MKNEIKIFTDGACSGNPGVGGYASILILPDFVYEIGGKEDNTTNNRMEMKALVESIKFLENKKINFSEKEIIVFTDSSYLLNGITSWIKGWKKNNWKTQNKTDVLNKDLWIVLDDLILDKNIKLQKVSGHSGVPLNERCDEIAVNFSLGQKVSLFEGNVSDYKISLDIAINDDLKDKKDRKGKQAYSYVSKIDGKIFVDKNWQDCKDRVSGVSSAKYKKSLDEEDEKKIIEEFSK